MIAQTAEISVSMSASARHTMARPLVDPSDLTDHAHMQAVRAGDLAQLGPLFERHHRPLFGFFVRLTAHRSTSEDLVQQVFLRILKYRHTYRDEGKFTTWMYHLARKVAADHFYQINKTSLSDIDEHPALLDQTPHAADQAAHADEHALLRRALASLPVEQREILTLHRLQQLPYDELAELFGCSVGAMKVRVHRALQALRDAFQRLSQTPSSL